MTEFCLIVRFLTSSIVGLIIAAFHTTKVYNFSNERKQKKKKQLGFDTEIFDTLKNGDNASSTTFNIKILRAQRSYGG